MPIEAVAITAVASTSNALLSLCRYGLHYVEIPAEVEQFCHAIENLQSTINTTKRLRRVKSSYLDNDTKTEVDGTIKRSESVLTCISQTIEACRADIATIGTVKVKNRLEYMLRGHDAFMARGVTLNSCLHTLGMQIGRMDAMQQPNIPDTSAPPSYIDSLSPEQTLRAPSTRKSKQQPHRSTQTQLQAPVRAQISQRTSFSNLSTFSFSTEKELAFTGRDSADTASVFSYEEYPSATMSSIPHLSCPGDYCTDEFCPNHTRRESYVTQTSSVDYGSSPDDWSSKTSFSTTSPPLSSIRPTSSRRKNKAGLI